MILGVENSRPNPLVVFRLDPGRGPFWKLDKSQLFVITECI